MSTPDVPLRIDLSVEVPGTPEQVWDATATATGISAWFMPTDVDEREGGTIHFHLGEDMESAGTVTAWEPPRRFAYVEPDWAQVAGQERGEVTPMATEFLVEARSGGTCVVRVVSSAFGTGADWEREFFADMERMWVPFFAHLRLYLTHFTGQRATHLSASATAPGRPEPLYAAIRKALGATEVGQRVDIRGATGLVERIGDEALLLRITHPVPGFLAFYAYDKGDGSATAQVSGYLFAPDAAGTADAGDLAAYVEREQPAWRAWLAGLTVPAA